MKLKAIIFFVLSGLISGCVGVMAVGAAGSMMVYDRRSITMIERDSRIFYVINRALANDRRFRDSHISITSFNQVVLLTGEVTAIQLKSIAAKVARETPNVRRVYDELTVDEPLSIAQHSKDSLISGHVRTNMLTQSGLESGSIRIITENATVYLMGIATHEQADLAVNVARQVPGVQKVVKIFQYIV